MSKVKEWAMTHQECPVCGKCFLPWERKENDDGLLTTCSQICDNEKEELLEAIADSQNNQGENNG